MRRLLKFFFVTNIKFIVFFIASYLVVVLFLNYVSAITVVGDLMQPRMEPIYHFLLRYMNVIEGGKFQYDSKDLRLVVDGFLYPLIPLYLIELLIYRAVSYSIKKKPREA
jgi:hypothetical protein